MLTKDPWSRTNPALHPHAPITMKKLRFREVISLAQSQGARIGTRVPVL